MKWLFGCKKIKFIFKRRDQYNEQILPYSLDFNKNDNLNLYNYWDHELYNAVLSPYNLNRDQIDELLDNLNEENDKVIFKVMHCIKLRKTRDVFR